MSEHLTSAVGSVRPGSTWRVGGPPRNKAVDQGKVIKLLGKIPSKQGGKKEAWTTLPMPGPDGTCTAVLGDAIYAFQSFWKANGTFHNIDGVVDPNGNTLRVLNTLALGGAAKAGGPNGQLPANTPDRLKPLLA